MHSSSYDNRTQDPLLHPRQLGMWGTTALAMGGCNQSLFILAALFVGQGDIPGQGSAAVPLLMVGLLLAWAAAPGWTELVLMFPNRVGGVASSCVEAFRPYSPVLANLTGVCYWWGWVPTCGLTAILSASALHHWYLPQVPVTPMAISLLVFFTGLNFCGIHWVARFAIPIASISAVLALISGIAPILSGSVDWQQATTFTLTTPFDGYFGQLTSLMAGLYLIGFAAPAFEAAACHVGETRDPTRTLPRAMVLSGLLAGVYFIFLPLVWLGTLGPEPLGKDLALVLGPTFAPLFGSAAKAAAIWFMVFSMFSGTLQPLAGAARTLSQLAEDGLLPKVLAKRNRRDTPWAATLLTAVMSIIFLLIGDPIWLLAAANFTYLIGISLPSLAVWLLRRDAPNRLRPYKAPQWAIHLGLATAGCWGISALLGFEQFGLPTVVIGLLFAYSGSALYAWRRLDDRREAGLPGIQYGLQLKLTGAMLLVLLLDGIGYLLAVHNVTPKQGALMTGLSDIFVSVAILTIAVALVLPGMIAHAARQVSEVAQRLSTETMPQFSAAMQALGRGDLDAAHATVLVAPVHVYAQDEVGEMAKSFNQLQTEIGKAVASLGSARRGLMDARNRLTDANAELLERLHELHQTKEKLSGILESVDNVIWSMHPRNHRLLYVNAAVMRSHGHDAGTFLADSALWLNMVHALDRTTVDHWLSHLSADAAQSIKYRIVHADGSTRWIEDRARLVVEEHGLTVRIDGVASDVSERVWYDTQMAYLANHDALTGLPNRHLLNDRIEIALAQAHRSQQSAAVLFLDLDGFKYINDSFGHSVGDVLLKNIAQRLQQVLNEGDIAARLGGDEFVVLLPLADAQHAAVLAEQILSELGRVVMVAERELYVSASVGICIFPHDGNSTELLLQRADMAMYRAKDLGRSCYQFYDQAMSALVDQRVELELALRSAVAHNELTVHYQPLVLLKTGKIYGMEALLRWEHPRLGNITPDRFIPLAESIGLISTLGRWVWTQACTDLKHLHALGFSDLLLAVNVSSHQLYQVEMVNQVRSVITELGISADQLIIELTESGLIQHSEAMITMLEQLKALGVTIALDDFGTGYSSLSYLGRFPIDVLKIDKSFTQNVGEKPGAIAIVRAILAMAQTLGLRTVAEGVETQAQLDFYRATNCDAIQGFLVGHPCTAQAFAHLLQAVEPEPESELA